MIHFFTTANTNWPCDDDERVLVESPDSNQQWGGGAPVHNVYMRD